MTLLSLHLQRVIKLVLLVLSFFPRGSSTDSQQSAAYVADCTAICDFANTATIDSSWNWRCEQDAGQFLDPCCSLKSPWSGITCANDRVTRLVRPFVTGSGYQTGGSLPESLGSLDKLVELNLNGQGITGYLPSLVGNLGALTLLDLSNNFFTGPIPDTWGSLISLSQLFLASSYLSGPISPSFGQLINLQHLVMYGNYFSGSLPETFGQLTALRYLDMNSNGNLVGPLHSSLGQLTSLATLDLSACALTGGLPSTFSQLTKMQILRLYSNQGLSGSIGPISQLPALQELSLVGCRFTGVIPDSLGSISTLTFIQLRENAFTSTIPTQFANLKKLTYLGVGYNRLVGSIPPSLGGLTALTALFLESNQFTGVVPTQMASLSKLVHFFAYGNHLQGKIPFAALASLGSLYSLDLSSNKFSGTLAGGIGLLTRLGYLRLGANLFQGGIPSETGFLTALSELSLPGARLTGTLPSQLGSLTYLQTLDVSNNRLTGSIIPQLGLMKSLSSLMISDNSLVGKLPGPELALLTRLTILDAHNTTLSGSLPTALASLTNLQTLQLSGTAITGSISSQLCSIKSLKTLDVRRTALSCFAPCLVATISADPFCTECSSTPPVQTQIAVSLVGLSLSDARRLEGSLTLAMAQSLGVPARFVSLALVGGSRRLGGLREADIGGGVASSSSRRLSASTTGTFTVTLPAAYSYSFPTPTALASALASNILTLTGVVVSVVVSFPSPAAAAASSRGSGLGAGVIAGIAVGSLALVVCLAISARLCRHHISEMLLGKEFRDFEDYQQRQSTSAKVYIAPDNDGPATGDSQSALLSRITMRFSSRMGASALVSLNGAAALRRSATTRSSGDSVLAKRTIDWDKLDPLEIIGEGAFGLVFRARWMGRNKSNNMEVAVKVVKLGKFEQAAAMVALDEEAEILEAAVADHLNEFVVKLVGTAVGTAPSRWKEKVTGKQVIGEDNLMIALVLKFEAGGNLRSLLKGKNATVLRTADKVRLIAQIADGLFFLHQNQPENIVHGDIKPENVLLSSVNISSMQVRLADFGMSKLTADKGSARSATALHGHAGGTWMYQAPETLQNNMPNSRTTDMFSFGTLAWEVLTGRDPWPECVRDGPDKCPEDCFDANPGLHYNSQTRLNRINAGGSLDFSMLPKDVPLEVTALIQRCLSYDHGKDWRQSAKNRPQIGEARPVLHQALSAMTSGHFDVFISYAWGWDKTKKPNAWRQPLAMALVEELRDMGFRAWLDVFQMKTDLELSMRTGIANSKCVVVLLSPDYVLSKNCSFELDVAVRAGKPIITCLVEPGGAAGEGKWWKEWEHPATGERAFVSDAVSPWMDTCHSVLKLDKQMVCSFGGAAAVDWTDEAAGSDRSTLTQEKALPQLATALKDFNIHPSAPGAFALGRRRSSILGRKASISDSRKMSVGALAASFMGMSKVGLGADDEAELRDLEENKARVAKMRQDNEKRLLEADRRGDSRKETAVGEGGL